jgi:hypothetical protein
MEPISRLLLQHQFHAPIFGATFFCGVGLHGCEARHPVAGEACAIYVVGGGQCGDHGFCAAFAERHVRFNGTDVVSVAYNVQLEVGALLK